MRFRDRPVEQKIFLTILPICLFPSIVFLGLVIVGLRLTFERAMGIELDRNAALLANNFDRYIDQRAAGLRHWLPRIESAADNQINSGTFAAPPGVQAGAVLLANGSSSASLRVRLAVLDPAFSPLRAAILNESDFYQERFSGRTHLTTEGLLLNHTLLLPSAAAPQRLVYLVLPRHDGFAIFMDTPLALMQDFRQWLPNPPDDMYVFSSDLFPIETGSSVAPALYDAIRSALRMDGLNGGWFPAEAGPRHLLLGGAQSQRMKRLAAGFASPLVWTFILPYDMEAFLGPQDSLIWLSALLVLALMLVLLAVAVASARWIVAPLHRLRAQAEALAGGNLNVQVAITSRDEVGRVGEAFNIMAARLRKSYASLEERLEENRLHTEHIYVLNQLTSAIIQALSLDRIFEILCADLHKICPCEAIWIALLDRAEHDLTIAHIQPSSLITLFERGRIPSRRSLHGRVISTAETHHAQVGAQHSGEFFETHVFNTEGLQSFLIAPLPGREGLIGTFSIASGEPEAYTSEVASIITSLANAVAVAIEQTTLFQQISHMAEELERKIAERTAELRRATRKLLQTEKYFATGRMAGNLGHEINNPLGIIKNYLNLVKTQLEKTGGGRRSSDPNMAHLGIIDEEVNRIAGLVRQLLDLHRPIEHKVQPVDLNALLDDILALMEDSLHKMNIRVERDFDPGLPKPIASPDLLRQVFINLLRNAQDAMDATSGTLGGTLGGELVGTLDGVIGSAPGSARSGENVLAIRTSTLSQWEDGREVQIVRIRFADTGCGIPQENITQIFDPFFTTKPSEQGSGLGLCISYGIVRMYRGTIDVESQPGAGAAFLISLPILEREAEGPGALAPLLEPDPAILW